MARLSHEIEYLAALIGVKLAQALPSGLADALASGLGRATGALLASRRRVAIENLRRGMGDALSREQMETVVRDVFRNTGRTLFEFARMGKIIRHGIDRIVVDTGGRDYMEKVYGEGKGGLVVTAHFGNFELLGAWAATRGFPADFLTGVQHNAKVNDLLNGFRREVGVDMIPVNKGLKGVFRVLKNNHFLALVSDQHAPDGVVVEFFGRPAATPRGPAVFSVRTGAPILPFVMKRNRHDHHELLASEPIYPPATGDQDADVLWVTQEYTRRFETWIREYPGQWLWTHRRWKIARD